MMVLVPSISCFLYKNCKDERMARKDSERADLGRSKTDKLDCDCLMPITPIIGIEVRLVMSSVFKIAFSIKKMPKTINKGMSSPMKKAIT